MILAGFLRTFIIISLCILSNVSIAGQSEILYEKIYIIKSKGIKTGYIHVSQRKKPAGENSTVIVTRKHFEQKFKRHNDKIQIIQDQSFVEDESGNPVQFSFSSKSKGEDIRLTGNFNRETGQVLIKAKINNIKEEKIIDLDEKILFPYAIDRLYRETKSNALRYYTLEPGLNPQILEIKSEKLEKQLLKQGKLNGVYTKYRNEVNIFPNTDLYVWRDENGHVVREYTSILDMEQFEVDRDEILNISPEFDVFSESCIKVEKTIADPGSIDQAIYKITAENMAVDNIFITDENQRIIQVKDNTVFLKVEAEKYEDYKFPYPVKKEGYENYLRSGPFVITDSESIKNLADRLTANENDAFKIAKKMKQWVYDNIADKSFAFDFANSVKVLETGSGDCTEHSILLASLLRAAGIPAKVVVGLVYTDSPENAFTYHMWVKAYTGKWVSLDPSLPYDNFTPLHIAMTESDINNISARSDMVVNIINSFKKLDIEILNVSKPVVSKTGSKPKVKVNLDNRDFRAANNFVSIKINEFRPAREEIREIDFPAQEEKDSIKEAFYSFTRGETENALQELKNFYETIHPDDNFLKMKLVLKLISMNYFNFARQVLDDVNDREIWGSFINELYVLYFPRQFFPDEKEKILYTAFYALNYKNDPDFVLELTKDIEKYDYIHYLRAKALTGKKELQKAENEINLALSINPGNLTYNLLKIEVLSGQNEIYEAQKTINQVNLITKSHKIKDKEFWKKFKSYDYWLKVKQFRENIVLSKYYEAYYYLIQGEIDSAISILNKLADKESEPYIFELLAEAYYEIDQFQPARKYFEKTLMLDENNVKSNLKMGNIYFLYGKYSKARQYYQKVLQTNPKNIDALLCMAKLHIYLEKEDEALDYFKKILDADKENTDVIYNIAVILANRKQYEEAEEMLKKVLSAAPMEHYHVWLGLAKVQLARGYQSKAVKSLKNVKYLDEDNAFYYYYTGLILRDSGNKEEANKYLKKALDLEPDLLDKL